MSVSTTGFTTVSSTRLQDAAGNLISDATIYFAPVDNKGNSISFRAGGTDAGQVMQSSVSASVTNGAFSVQLADTAETSPLNVGYAVSVVDNLTGRSLLGAGYGCIQPTGATWSLDTYTPNLAAQETLVSGPAGTSIVPKGAFSTAGIYTPGDLVSYTDGLSYINYVATGTDTGGTLVAVAGNIFDKTAITEGSVIDSDTGVLTSGFSGYSSSDFMFVYGATNFVTNIPMGFFSPGTDYGIAFYDINKTFLSGISNTAGGTTTTAAVPSGAYWVRCWWADATLSAGVGIAAAMVNVGTTLLSSYAAYNGGPSSSGNAVPPPNAAYWQLLSTGTQVSPWSGKTMGVFGDSITAFNVWQQGVAAAHGMTLGLNSGQSGFTTIQMFDQYLNSGQPSGGTVNMTALGAALAGIDLLIIEFGTNDGYYINTVGSETLGTFADGPTVNSFYGAMQRALQTLFTLRPTGMTVIWLTPYHTQRLAGQTLPSGDYDTHYTDAFLVGSLIPAIKQVCEQYAVPVIDQSYNGLNMYNFANPDGSALMLRDHLHPSAAGFTDYMIPYISRAIDRYAKVA